MAQISIKELSQKYIKVLIPQGKNSRISGPLTPILIVPLSRRTRIGIYTPLIFFLMCLPAVLTEATSASAKIVFAVSFIFVFGLCVSYSLYPAITFNRDQLILHHKNQQYFSVIMYQDIVQVANRHSTLMIETHEKTHYSLPFSQKYWLNMKKIFSERNVIINLQTD